MLQCGRKYVSSPPFVPESGSQLYHAVFDRRAGERRDRPGQERFRDVVIREGCNNDVRKKNAGGDPLVPAHACKPCVPPLREARSQSFMK